ncbi:GmrSD restriction endonuclease domain-containing protein [Butyricimonas paravirosa]
MMKEYGDYYRESGFYGFRENIRISKQDFSIIQLQRMSLIDRLLLQNNLYNNNVLTSKSRGKLIESILLGIPLPVFYIYETRNGELKVIEGRNQLRTILSFLENKLVLENLDLLSELNGCRFSDLGLKDQGIFEEYTISFFIIQPPTPEIVTFEIFNRINVSNLRLDAQALRRTLFPGRTINLLDEIIASDLFRDLTSNRLRGNNAQRTILRSLVFYYWKIGELYPRSNNIELFLTDSLLYFDNVKENDFFDDNKKLFLQSLYMIFIELGDMAFSIQNKNEINTRLMEVLLFLFCENIRRNRYIDRVQVQEYKEKFRDNRNYPLRGESLEEIDHRYNEIIEFFNLPIK